jgi:hypothetical protein
MVWAGAAPGTRKSGPTQVDQEQRNRIFAGLLRDWGKPLLVLGLMVLGAWQAYQIGLTYAGTELVSLRETYKGLKSTMADLQSRNLALQERIAILERSNQIDSEVYREVTSSLQKMEYDVLRQQEELAFYRGIVSPAHAKTGLRIQSLELIPGVAPLHFRYSLLLTQVTRNNRHTQGVAKIKVNGSQAGVPKSLPLAEVSQPMRKTWNFRFRYFQSLEGELQLPMDFEPETIQVEVRPADKSKPTLQRTFGWLLEE